MFRGHPQNFLSDEQTHPLKGSQQNSQALCGSVCMYREAIAVMPRRPWTDESLFDRLFMVTVRVYVSSAGLGPC